MLTVARQKTLTKGSSKVDFSAVLVVYKSKEGVWKGFAHPYNVVTEASTKAEALAILKGLVDAYEGELRIFNFPSHLISKSLNDLEDRQVFQRVIEDAIEQKGIVDRVHYHAETHHVRP